MAWEPVPERLADHALPRPGSPRLATGLGSGKLDAARGMANEKCKMECHFAEQLTFGAVYANQ